MATVLSYLICWEQTEKFMRCLSKRSIAYFEAHQEVLRHFIMDKPIGNLQLAFGPKSFQTLKPKRFATIGELEFLHITDDLHSIENFVKGTQKVHRLYMGNRGFKLFNTATLD